MDQRQIEDIVRAVMDKIGGNGDKGSGLGKPAGGAILAGADGSSLPDLGSDAVKNWIGVQEPKRREVLEELKKSTAARVCSGRIGPRLRTTSFLRFLADHSRSKDTVLQDVPGDWLGKTGLLEVKSEASDKDQYLTRPDMGRRLSKEAIETINAKCKKNPQVQVIVSDGLSTDAVTVNYDELMTPLLKGLESARLDVGTPFFVRYGRVKIEDQVGELLGAKVVILLIGERPGLGQSESLSCYLVYSPTAATVEADRTCISNIHHGGTPPVEAAAVIVDLVKKMLEQKASGIALKN
ncbi:MAG: ethanolamine ammonia-lyase subunit EutC [Candidatus Accumulibacter sp.]|jgi:ethanolamine ammonia-lyase small subunit|nr:ethanolamine ammonia-lyase subunit EutC [Accumulibacter sp.]